MLFPLIFIVGPTAVGKSEVSFSLAKKIGADILSCDSMLVYKEPKIITSKPSDEMISRVRHYLVDEVSVEQEYSVYDFLQRALEVIESNYPKKPLIITGGSGLYFNVLLYGIFEGAGSDKNLRQSILSEAESSGDINKYLYNKLKQVDPEALAVISPNDTRRLVRALEVYYSTGERISVKKQQRSGGIWGKYPLKVFGLYKNRTFLYQDINLRAEKMFRQGAVEEVESLLKLNLSSTARKIIGIQQIKGYLEGRYSKNEALEILAKDTRRYAKRQFTWFRKEKGINWIDAENKKPADIAGEILTQVNV